MIFGKKAAHTTSESTTNKPTGGAPGGVNLRKAAGISLAKTPNMRRPWAVYLGADVSYSMVAAGYLPGDVERLAEAVLTVVDEGGMDDDRIVPCFPFASRTPKKPLELQFNDGPPASAGRRIVDHSNTHGGVGGGTSYANVIQSTWDHYRASSSFGKAPLLGIIQTDGADGDLNKTKQVLVDLSHQPAHWVFVFFGSERSREAATLRDLDSGKALRDQLVDNVSVVWAGERPSQLDPTVLYDGLLTGPSQWLKEAPARGIAVPGA